MHEKTKQDLETLQRWTVQVINADRYLKAMEAAIPERQDDDVTYASVSTSIGDIHLTLWQAESVDQISPYLAEARRLGFRRVERTENPAENSVAYKYELGEDESRVRLHITLRLRSASTDGEQAKCRYVQTGTKEVPVMELKCGADLEAWEAVQA